MISASHKRVLYPKRVDNPQRVFTSPDDLWGKNLILKPCRDIKNWETLAPTKGVNPKGHKEIFTTKGVKSTCALFPFRPHTQVIPLDTKRLLLLLFKPWVSKKPPNPGPFKILGSHTPFPL